jgi:hypothetical protein
MCDALDFVASGGDIVSIIGVPSLDVLDKSPRTLRDHADDTCAKINVPHLAVLSPRVFWHVFPTQKVNKNTNNKDGIQKYAKLLL